MRGTVKFYDLTRGFGFIRPDDARGDEDIFVHASALTKAGIPILNNGDIVSFDVVPSKRRAGQFVAANVQVLVANL